MIDYIGFSYRPDYGYAIYDRDGAKIGEKEKINYAVCFSEVFNIFRRNPYNKIYKATYTLRCRKEFKYRSGNYCALSKIQIQKIIRYMRKAFDIGVNVYETDENFIFTFRIEGKSIKHKFVLTFSRVFFEFPFNEAAKEALFLRELKEYDGIYFGNKSFLEVYNVVCAGYTNIMSSGHSLFYYPTTDLNIKIFKEICKNNIDQVQKVYWGTRDLYNKCTRIESPSKLNWEEPIEKRLPLHSKNFRTIKDYKDAKKKDIRRRKRAGVQQVD